MYVQQDDEKEDSLSLATLQQFVKLHFNCWMGNKCIIRMMTQLDIWKHI